MPTHLGFLRAVNIGKRQYTSGDLRSALDAAGYGEVDTHIQTGNIRVTSPLRSRAKIEAELEAVFLADRGFEVPTIVFSPAELRRVVADADEIAEEGFTHGHYINLLKRPIPADLLDELTGLTQEGVRFVARDRAMHLLYNIAFGQAKQPSARATEIIGTATNRSAKVIRTIAEKWC